MNNIVYKNGKKFIKQARLPRGAYPQKPLGEVVEVSGVKKRIDWGNLKKNLCPQCGKDFVEGLTSVPVSDPAFTKTLVHPCGFKISERRYTEIVSSQVNAAIEERQIDDEERFF